jgi:hypothetical protein
MWLPVASLGALHAGVWPFVPPWCFPPVLPAAVLMLGGLCCVTSRTGLLHSQDPDWVTSFVTAAGQRFAAELAAGSVDSSRVLLRLFSCLTLTSVLHPADVLGLMERLTEVAAAAAAAGGARRRCVRRVWVIWRQPTWSPASAMLGAQQDIACLDAAKPSLPLVLQAAPACLPSPPTRVHLVCLLPSIHDCGAVSMTGLIRCWLAVPPE